MYTFLTKRRKCLLQQGKRDLYTKSQNQELYTEKNLWKEGI